MSSLILNRKCLFTLNTPFCVRSAGNALDSASSRTFTYMGKRPSVVVSSVTSPTTLPRVPFYFTWNEVIDESQFTTSDILAIDDKGIELKPITGMLTAVDSVEEIGRRFSVVFDGKDAEWDTLTVSIRPDAVKNKAGNGNQESNKVTVYRRAPGTVCEAPCQHGTCVDNECLCEDGWQHDSEWIVVRDCSVPIGLRRSIFILLASLLGIGFVYSFWLLLMTSGERLAPFKGKKQLTLFLGMIWCMVRIGFLLARLDHPPWTTLDVLLLSIPEGILYTASFLALDVYVSVRLRGAVSITSRATKMLLLCICVLYTVVLTATRPAYEWLFAADLMEMRESILVANLSIRIFFTEVLLFAYIFIVWKWGLDKKVTGSKASYGRLSEQNEAETWARGRRASNYRVERQSTKPLVSRKGSIASVVPEGLQDEYLALRQKRRGGPLPPPPLPPPPPPPPVPTSPAEVRFNGVNFREKAILGTANDIPATECIRRSPPLLTPQQIAVVSLCVGARTATSNPPPPLPPSLVAKLTLDKVTKRAMLEKLGAVSLVAFILQGALLVSPMTWVFFVLMIAMELFGLIFLIFVFKVRLIHPFFLPRELAPPGS